MPQLATFAEVEAALAKLAPNALDSHAQHPERMTQLMEFLGNPQDTYKVVHVAGTSGKTSTAYYVAALLQAAGRRVGLTISPHVDAINERVQIGLQPLPQAEFCTEFGDFLELIKPSGIVPMYFEACIAFAFWQFARRGVEYAVIEVGVGGLVDSTNVVHQPNKICVITDIGYGHVGVLGHTLAEIAAQKAGIIQLHNSVFCHPQGPEIMQQIRARAQQKQADLHEVDEPMAADVAFLPQFQQRNFHLSKAVAQFALARDGGDAARLTPTAIMHAAHTLIPGRMELRTQGDKTIILDGAHNPQKLRALVASLQVQFPDQPVAVLFALTRSSPAFVARMVHELRPLRPYVIATGFAPDPAGHYGSVAAENIQTALQPAALRGEMIADPTQAFAALLARPEQILLVTGSFYLLNPIRPLLTGNGHKH